MKSIESMEVHQFQSDEILIAKEVLGRGAYGIVLQGFHKLYGNLAVKCAIVEGGRKIEEKIKFEIQNLQRCSHESVVRILGCTIFMKTLAIVMEHVPGGNLMELLLDEEILLSPLLRLRQSEEIASGVAFIHNLPGKRLVHGDLKPENILLTADLHCKIADFGESKLSSYTCCAATTDNQSGSNKYTKIYAAPELLLNATGTRKPSHDTYSFGMTLFIILNRNLPILSDSYLPLYLEAIKTKQRPDMCNIISWRHQLEQDSQSDDVSIIDLLLSVMRSCWDHDPSSRPAMLIVKKQLHSLLETFHPSKMQKDVAKATRTMQFNDQISSNDLIPLDQFIWPHQQESSLVDTCASVTPLTAATDFTDEQSSNPSVSEYSESLLNSENLNENNCESKDLEINDASSGLLTTSAGHQMGSQFSETHEDVFTAIPSNTEVSSQTKKDCTKRDTKKSQSEEISSLQFSLTSRIPRFISSYLHRENPKVGKLSSKVLGSSVDPPIVECSESQISTSPSHASCSGPQNYPISSSHLGEEAQPFEDYQSSNSVTTSMKSFLYDLEAKQLGFDKEENDTDEINKEKSVVSSQHETEDIGPNSRLNLIPNETLSSDEVENIPSDSREENCSNTIPKEPYIGPMIHDSEATGIVRDRETSPILTSPTTRVSECTSSTSYSSTTSSDISSLVQKVSELNGDHLTRRKSSQPIISPLRTGSVANSLIQSLMCSVGAPIPEVATSYTVPPSGDLKTACSLISSRTEQRSIQFTYFDLTSKEQYCIKGKEKKIVKTLEEINDCLNCHNVKDAIQKVNQLIKNTDEKSIEHCEITINSVIMISRTLAENMECVLAVRFIDWCIDFSDHAENLLIKLDLLEKCCDAVHSVTTSMYSDNDMASIRRFSLKLLGKLHRHKISPLKVYNLNRKAIVEISCLIYIGYCYFYLQKYDEVDEICNSCISTLTTRFADKANNYQLFAHSYNLKAYANYYMQNHTFAIELYKKAVVSFECAKDLNTTYKQEMIDAVRQSINEAPFTARFVAFSRKLLSKSL